MKLRDDRLAADRLLCTEEAAALLGIPRSTLRRYAAIGAVPSLKIGKSANSHRLYDRRTILALRGQATFGAHSNGKGGTT